MADPAVTYSFTNGLTADADEVNQNFTDIIDNISSDSAADLGCGTFKINTVDFASAVVSAVSDVAIAPSTLTVENVYANEMEISNITMTSNLYGNVIDTNDLSASYASCLSLEASYLQASETEVSNVTISSNLYGNVIATNDMEASYISAPSAEITYIQASECEISNMTMTSNLYGNVIACNDMESSYISSPSAEITTIEATGNYFIGDSTTENSCRMRVSGIFWLIEQLGSASTWTVILSATT